MEIQGWKYYNHAIIPDCAPHKEPDVSKIGNKNDWDKRALLARYTTDFDCKNETGWWYCIKDTPINLEDMKAKKRYEITRGLKAFDVKKIEPLQYGEELYSCFIKAAERYQGYKIATKKDEFIAGLSNKNNREYYAAFYKDTGELAGYAINTVYEDYVSFSTAKFDTKYIGERVAAAIIYTILYDYINIQGKKYVCDGERCISHKTNMQNYLESLFGFRKAYCVLNIIYRKSVGIYVKILFPFRKLFTLMEKNKMVSNINSVLKMEEIVRKQKRV